MHVEEFGMPDKSQKAISTNEEASAIVRVSDRVTVDTVKRLHGSPDELKNYLISLGRL